MHLSERLTRMGLSHKYTHMNSRAVSSGSRTPVSHTGGRWGRASTAHFVERAERAGTPSLVLMGDVLFPGCWGDNGD